MLFLLTSAGIAMAGDDAKNKTDSNNSKITGLYDNVRILQEQINNLTLRLHRIVTVHGVEDRFTDMEDGTIQDNDSGLIWLKDANCFDTKNWSDAMAAAASLAHGQCGIRDDSVASDWRLPTKYERAAFYSPPPPHGFTEPALVNTAGDAQWSEGDAFNRVQSDQYWSKTEGEMTGDAWFAMLFDGAVYEIFKNWEHAYVWPVRHGIN